MNFCFHYQTKVIKSMPKLSSPLDRYRDFFQVLDPRECVSQFLLTTEVGSVPETFYFVTNFSRWINSNTVSV